MAHSTTSRHSRRSLQCSPRSFSYHNVVQGNNARCRVKVAWTIVFITLTQVYSEEDVYSQLIQNWYITTQAYYPVLAVKKTRRSTPSETSKKPWTQDHSRTQRRTEGGETSPGFPVWDHRALANYMLLFPRKDFSEDNGTKTTEPHQAAALLGKQSTSCYLYREVEDYRYNMHILPV